MTLYNVVTEVGGKNVVVIVVPAKETTFKCLHELIKCPPGDA